MSNFLIKFTPIISKIGAARQFSLKTDNYDQNFYGNFGKKSNLSCSSIPKAVFDRKSSQKCFKTYFHGAVFKNFALRGPGAQTAPQVVFGWGIYNPPPPSNKILATPLILLCIFSATVRHCDSPPSKLYYI